MGSWESWLGSEEIMDKRIELPVYGIIVELTGDGGGSISSDLHEDCPYCCQSECYLHCDESQAGNEETEEDMWERADYNKRMDAIESLILAQACAGIDIESSAYLEALKTGIEAISNNTII